MRNKWYLHYLSPFCNGCASLAEISLSKEGYTNVPIPHHSDMIIISGRFVGDEKEKVLDFLSRTSSDTKVILIGNCAVFSLEDLLPYDSKIEGCPINIINFIKFLRAKKGKRC